MNGEAMRRDSGVRWSLGWIAIGTMLFGASGASAQETVTYYTSDAVGSVRMVTDAAGGVLARYDYLPFGDICGSACGPVASADRRQFAGEEKDSETGLDYFGARYYVSGAGRFTSPDPVTVNELRVVSPQRWNRYAYAVNNPLNFGDPDGLDVIVFNFMDGAKGYGHLGIMAVNPQTGSAVYGGFNPQHVQFPFDRGRVALTELPAGFVRFENGRPTLESWSRLKEQVRDAENHPYGAIRAAYYQTGAAETSRLRQHILSTWKSPHRYNIVGRNCEDFCIVGLRAAGLDLPTPQGPIHALPNVYFSLTLLDLAVRLSSPAPGPSVKTTETYCVPQAGACP